jgi:hypothetical protein
LPVEIDDIHNSPIDLPFLKHGDFPLRKALKNQLEIHHSLGRTWTFGPSAVSWVRAPDTGWALDSLLVWMNASAGGFVEKK